MPRNESGSSLRITTTTVENQTIQFPVGSGSDKSPSRVPSTGSSSAFLSALAQNFLLRSLVGVHATSHNTDTFRNALASLTRKPALATTGSTSVKDEIYGADSIAKNIKGSRAIPLGLQPLFKLRTTTTTTTTLMNPNDGRLFSNADASTSGTATKSAETSAAATHTGGPTKPCATENTHRQMSVARHHTSGQTAAQRAPSSLGVETKGKPCRLQPPLPPVLNCRFKCDNPKHDERYEMEKDGTPCHLHMRVKSLVGVCVNGWCQQAANK